MEAYEFAREAHRGQTRKGDGSPYINHPAELGRLLAGAGAEDPELIAAAFLHDVVEDTDVTLEEIADAFGDGVASLVAAMSEDKDLAPWQRRKDHHRDTVEAAGERAIMIYAADKLANSRDMRTLFANVGEGAARRFNAPIDTRIEVWRRDAEMIARHLPDFVLLAELHAELDAFTAERASKA